MQIILGVYPRRCLRKLKNIPWYFKTRRAFLKQNHSDFPFGRSFPCLGDVNEESGNGRGHYFYQDLLIAQEIFKASPQKHIDIGSRIDGFVAHIASFREIEVLDVRPLSSDICNVTFLQADLMRDNLDLHNYCDSLSCLHALEHFGLGRYGDPIDADGHLKGLENMYKILKEGGCFYFSVPMGTQRIEFNAHRVFSLQWLLNYFEKKYKLLSFSYVDDVGNLHQKISLTSELILTNCGCNYGCAIFILRKEICKKQ